MNAYWKMCTIAKMFYTMEWHEMERKKYKRSEWSPKRIQDGQYGAHITYVTFSGNAFFFVFLSIKR